MVSDTLGLSETLTRVTGVLAEPCFIREELCIDDITDDHIVQFGWAMGDSSIVNVVIVEYDFDHVEDRFTIRTTFRYNKSIEDYGERDPLLIQSRGLKTEFHGLEIATIRARGVFARLAIPPVIIETILVYQKHLYEVGDIICVSSQFIPNRSTGLRGINAVPFEIISQKIDIAEKGRVHLRLLEANPFFGLIFEEPTIETTSITEETP